MVVRLRLFKLKPNSEITFTPLCVFGFNRKYGQLKNQLHVDCKNTNFSCKSNAALILPSNDFQDSQREKERERESTGGRLAKLQQPRSCCPHRPDHATPLPRSHWPSFLFFLSSSSTLLLPLAQHRRSSCHQPPTHYTPPPNPPFAPMSFLHCLNCIWVRQPPLTSNPHTSAQLSLSLTSTKPYPPPKADPPSTKANPHLPSNPSNQNPPSNPKTTHKCFYFDFWLC